MDLRDARPDEPGLLDVAVAGPVADEEQAEEVLKMRFVLHWAWRAQLAARRKGPWQLRP